MIFFFPESSGGTNTTALVAGLVSAGVVVVLVAIISVVLGVSVYHSHCCKKMPQNQSPEPYYDVILNHNDAYSTPWTTSEEIITNTNDAYNIAYL